MSHLTLTHTGVYWDESYLATIIKEVYTRLHILNPIRKVNSTIKLNGKEKYQTVNVKTGIKFSVGSKKDSTSFKFELKCTLLIQ